jgi:exodeoxyribonuclease VII large subunit
MEPRGLGALQLAFEQLKARLGGEGLFDHKRKRALPFLPAVVGIVTALGGAGLRDIVTIVLARYPNLHLIIRPARVQGAGAASEVAQAIDDLNRDARAKVLIVGRGGGSLEDLWAFNEEMVASALSSHRRRLGQLDSGLREPRAALRQARQRADEAAAGLAGALASRLKDRRRHVAALGAHLAPPGALVREMRLGLERVELHLAQALGARVARMRMRVDAMAVRLGEAAPRAMAERRRAAVAAAAVRLGAALERAQGRRRAELAALAARLDSTSPLKVLERGYAVAINVRDGRVVVDAERVEVGDELDLRLSRGILRARTIARQT